MPLAAASALAGPNGANVVGGAATVQGQGTANVTVNQSTQNAIINWQTFNIGSGETTRIYMPNSSSTQLDRVTGGQGASQILGTLYSNGKVFLVNPDGILFGMGARINVGSLVATTNDIHDNDFMAGKYNFTIPGNPNASIVNMGTITAQTSGFAALVAPGVRNTGTITARLGTIALASGNAFTLDMYGDNLITLGINDQIASQVVDVSTGKPLKSLVSNEGELKANGGTVVLTAVAARTIVDSVINNSGVIEANTIGSHNGMIVLGAATGVPNQKVKVSGRLSAAGKSKGTRGGTIQITGENIEVTGATINASGQAGGGTVLIGGDWGGGHPNTSLASGNASAFLESYAVANAGTVSIDAATMIDASAINTGNGGKVIIWANQATTFLGTILAKGGAQSGDGGFVETSGGTLTFNGGVNTTAANGKTGIWLLDPTDLTIDQTAAAEIVSALGNNNVVLETTRDGARGYGNRSFGRGDIDIDASISWSGNNTLTLDAYHDIVINNSISAANGGLALNSEGSIFANAAVTIGTFTLQNGAWRQVGSLPAFSANNFVIDGGSFLRASGGNGSRESPYQIVDIYGLQGIGSSSMLLSSDYVLANNIDASGTANWNHGAGFVPIGDFQNEFFGSLNGRGFAISNLTINSSAAYLGLFGTIGYRGSVENLGIDNISLTALGWHGSDYAHVGALAGLNNGTITASYATGTITSASRDGTAPDTGGLVGTNTGSISQSYAGVDITENSRGLDLYLGGLVGWNDGGTIKQSYATGTVTNTSDGSADVGGLIGYNTGTVMQTYATGAVTGNGSVGGLVGYNYRGSVTSSYWDTETTGMSAGLGGSSGGTFNASGLNTAEFGNMANFVGWNFGTTAGGASCSRGGACWVIVDSDGSLNNAGRATGATRAMLLSEWSTTITNPHQLQLMALDLSASYTLANNINLGSALSNGSDVWGVNAGAGFVPIGGNGATAFIGIFNGNGNTISNLTINSASLSYVGMFGDVGGSGIIQNLGLIGGSVSGGTTTGALAGANGGTLTNVYETGAVTGGNVSIVGGLVGINLVGGTITQAYATGRVTIGDTSTAGGLVGENLGNISQSYATGAVTGGDITSAGDLVGVNLSSIANSYATGAVTTGDFGTVGGLVGINSDGGRITQAYATGRITVGDTSSAGGLVGENFGNVSQSYATSAVTGGDITSAGGLVGVNLNSIANSYATGAVMTGDYGTVGGLAGYNLGGTIAQSYATGAVTVGANSFAGGLVGENFTGASITNSYATGVVSSNGINVELGGLVGQNDPGAVIVNSQAYGAVTSTASLLSQNNGNCSLIDSCEYVNAGGFVGANYGSISGTGWTSTSIDCTAGYACASGDVSVGALGQGGGFAGYNGGIIQYAFATGKVTGAAGFADTGNGNAFDNTTQIGGFVADNHGQIAHAFASGAVGTLGTMWLSAGGFASLNEGTIDSSVATGAVNAGDNSTAGGFVQSNSRDNNVGSCSGCYIGDGFDNTAAISNSQAYGNVTVGALSAAGGFATIGGGNSSSGASFTNISAFGAVNAGHDSIVGGLVGVLGENSTIANSSAQNTIVASSGANSIIGGVAGVNEGTISDTTSTASVSGTSDSYIGGITGINLGLITGSSTDPNISGSGGNNFIGGITGLNAGSIVNSTGQVGLSGGTQNYMGGVAGVNGSYTGSGALISNSTFPNGTITNSSSSGAGFTSQVGTTSASWSPGLPSWLAGCTDVTCTILTGGSLQQGTTSGNSDTVSGSSLFANQQVAQFTPVNYTVTNITPPLIDPTTLNATDVGAPSNGGDGGSGNTGSLANGRQGGNGAPPGVRLIDMKVMPLPPGTGLPPPGESRFLSNQLVLQFGPNMTPQQIAALAQRLGLTIVTQQTLGSLGRTIYTFQINNGHSVPEIIRAVNDAGLNAAPQPNYTYSLSQELSGSAGVRGDPAQYVVQKLQLDAVHRITEGSNVVVALIDSRVDPRQPDFAGRIVESYDAGCGPDTPPDAHGTGMAGAIASHIGLLGIAPSARIIAICAFGGHGSPEATSTKIIRGVDYAIAHGAKIINMSFAGPHDPALAQELQIAREKGILIIAAAGNAGAKSPPLFPGADPNVMAVTATDEHDRLFNGANQGTYVAVAAPGVNILVPAPNGDVQFTTGTSVASANVSGVAALLLAERPTRTPEEIRAILVSTAKHLGAKGVNPQFGAGLVDPLKALRFIPAALGRNPTAASRLQLH